MSERLMRQYNRIDKLALINAAYGLMGGGGGGNALELHNPFAQGKVVGLTTEIGHQSLPLYKLENMNEDDVVCCFARLGSPGVLADSFGDYAAQTIVQGIKKLCDETGNKLPRGIVPVEGGPGQIARATRAAFAAKDLFKEQGVEIGIVDADLCGGLAVPAVPLASKIHESLGRHPNYALIELNIDATSEEVARMKTDLEFLKQVQDEVKRGKRNVSPVITVEEQADPAKFEKTLRERADASQMGAVWFTWLMTDVKKARKIFTPGSVSNAIRSGEIVNQAFKENRDIAQALFDAGEIDRILTRGKVASIKKEKAPGFSQFAYEVITDSGLVRVNARNEYILVRQGEEIIGKQPNVINFIGPTGPIQSHMITEGDVVTIVLSTPQALKNNPEYEDEWKFIYQQYFKKDKYWGHGY